MFYYYLTPYLTYNVILVLAAVIPAAYLLLKVYRMDRLEKESGRFLWNLVKAGILSSLIALTSERILFSLLNSSVNSNAFGYRILLYFVIVGLSEEGAKYFMLKKSSWNSAEFNCLYDGLVYAVFVSLGFALCGFKVITLLTLSVGVVANIRTINGTHCTANHEIEG